MAEGNKLKPALPAKDYRIEETDNSKGKCGQGLEGVGFSGCKDALYGIERKSPKELKEEYDECPENFRFEIYKDTLCNSYILEKWLKQEEGRQLFIQICLLFYKNLEINDKWTNKDFQSALLSHLLEHMPNEVPRLNKIGLIDSRDTLLGWLLNNQYLDQIKAQKKQWEYLVVSKKTFVDAALNSPKIVFEQISKMIKCVGSYIFDSPDNLTEKIVEAFLEEHKDFNLLKLMRLCPQGAECLQNLFDNFPRFFKIKNHISEIVWSLSCKTKHKDDSKRLSEDYLEVITHISIENEDIRNDMNLGVDVAEKLVVFCRGEKKLKPDQILKFFLRMMTSKAKIEKSKWFYWISRIFCEKKDFEKFKGLKSCLHHLVQQDLQPLCDDMRKVESVFWQRLYDCVRNCHIDWQAFGGQCFEDGKILSEFLKEQNHEFWEPILRNEQTGKVAADEVFKTQHTCNLNV